MKIKALKSSFGDFGNVLRGQIIDIPDHRARQLVERGLYTDVLSDADEKVDAVVSVADEIDFDKLKKDDLVAVANEHGIEIDDSDTKAQIIEKLKAPKPVEGE